MISKNYVESSILDFATQLCLDRSHKSENF